MRPSLIVSCVLALGLSAVFAAGRTPAVAIGQEFVLPIGRTVMVEGAGFNITFVDVLEDSRCPVDATCVWAGNAKVQLKVEKGDGQNITVELSTDLDPRSAAVDGYTLHLLALAPVRHADAPVNRDEYAARLRVTET